MNYRISNCRGFSDERLYAAMNAAFADYVVPLTLTETGFRTFQRQRGFSADLSFVALNGDDIVAFWLSGDSKRQYGHRAYTLSVGTLPDHRRRGLSRKLLAAVVDRQRAIPGAAGLQLEVITTNAAAISSYEHMGFHRHRTLRVLKLTAEPSPQTDVPEVTGLHLSDLPDQTDDFFEAWPTPQNDRPALRALGQDVHLIGIREGDDLLAWAAAYLDGAVAQMAVHRKARRRGYGKALLHALWHAAGRDSLTFVNVDDRAVALNAFLEAAGAEELLQQFEMRLDFS